MTWFLAFLAVFISDVLWTRCVYAVRDDAALAGALWGGAYFLVTAIAVIGYTLDPWLLLPSTAGAMCGTYVGVVMKKQRAAGKSARSNKGAEHQSAEVGFSKTGSTPPRPSI